MKDGEIRAVSTINPLVTEALREIERGRSIELNNPLFQAYMLARQRGFVKRTGSDGSKIIVSERGKEFLERRHGMKFYDGEKK